MSIQSATSATAQHPIHALPADAMVSTFEYLPFPDMASFARTCKDWKRRFESESTLTQFFYRCAFLYKFPHSSASQPIKDYRQSFVYQSALYANMVNGVYEVHSLEGHTAGVEGMILVGDRLITGSKDKTIRIWDVNQRKCVQTIPTPEEVTSLNPCLFHGHLVTGDSKGHVKMWDFRNGNCLQTLKPYEDSSFSVSRIASTREKLIVGDHVGRIAIINPNDTSQLFHYSHGNHITGLMVAGNKLISSDSEADVSVCDLDTNKVSMPNTPSLACKYIYQLGIVGDKILMGCGSGSIKIWNRSNDQIESLSTKHCCHANSFLFGNGLLFSGGDKDGMIRISDLSKKVVLQTLKGHTGYVMGLAYANGKLYSCGFKGEVKIWDFNPKCVLEVTFDTGYGNSLVLCGKGGGLSWDPAKGVALVCKGRDNWVANIPAGTQEFKLVWKKKNGIFDWEKGPNRTFSPSLSLLIQQPRFSKGSPKLGSSYDAIVPKSRGA